MSRRLALDGYIAERAFNRPLLIEAQKARIIANFLERRFSADYVDADLALDMDPVDRKAAKPYQIVDGIAIVPIFGTLIHRGSFMSALSGVTSYVSLRNILSEAADDSDVNSILLDVDSGGGEVDGNFELANYIREINDDIKPVVAVANGSAFSGAYSLGVAAGKFFVTPTGGVGSVGVIIQHVDFSEQNKIAGIKVTNIVAGERKAELSSDFPLSDSARQMLQDEVNRIAEIFVDHVAEMRNINRDIVIDTQATLIFGEEAVKIGFVDGVVSYDEVLSELVNLSANAGTEQSSRRIEDMTINKKTVEENLEKDAALGEGTESEEEQKEVKEKEDAESVSGDSVEKAAKIVELCSKASMSDKAAAFIREGLSLEEVERKIDVATSIRQACVLAGKPDKAEELISSGKSLKQIQEMLINEMSGDQESTDISASQDPNAVDQDFSSARNVVLEDVERRKKEAEANAKGD